MKNIKVALVLGSLALVASACRTKSILVAEPQVETPQVAGRTGDFGLRADVMPARNLKPVRSPEDHPPDMKLRTEVNGDAIAALGLHAGLGARWEFSGVMGGGVGDNSGCGGIHAKTQVYGPSRAASKAGDTSVGISAHGFYCSTYQDGRTRFTGQDYEEDSDSQSYDVGASVGYHVLDLLMVYGGLAFAEHSIRQKVNQYTSDDGTIPSEMYKARITGESQSYALGLNYGGPTFWVNLRYNFAHSNYDYVNPDHQTAALGAGYGF